jgi:hypothetical protein
MESSDKLGINWELISKDPKLLTIVQLVSRIAEVEDTQKMQANVQQKQGHILQEQQKQLDHHIAKEKCHAGYYTVMGYANVNNRSIDLDVAKHLGRMASKICSTNNIIMGKVPDERYGAVGSYPQEVLEHVFVEFFRGLPNVKIKKAKANRGVNMYGDMFDDYN